MATRTRTIRTTTVGYSLEWVVLLALLQAPVHAQEDAPGQAPSQQRPPPVEAPPAPSPPAETPPDPRGPGVELATIIEQVAASSGREFLVDPRVRARVLSVPPIENPSYEDLLSMLRVHGYLAVEIAGRVNILPDANARQIPTRLLQRDDGDVHDDEWVTRVLTVPNGQAGQLVPLLRPMMPQPAHLAATGDGKLIIVDTYANVRRITELVNELSR